jgi:hypothetical protein
LHFVFSSHSARRFVNHGVPTGGFAMPSQAAKNGFVPLRFCFVVGLATKQTGISDRKDAATGSRGSQKLNPGGERNGRFQIGRASLAAAGGAR